MAPQPTPAPQPDDDPRRYVGLPAGQAERTAAEHGWTTVRTVVPGAVITMEFVTGRLNFEVEDGVVRRCWIG